MAFHIFKFVVTDCSYYYSTVIIRPGVTLQCQARWIHFVKFRLGHILGAKIQIMCSNYVLSHMLS